MRVNIVTKNLNVSDNLKAVIEKKIEKLGKYFSDDITANVMLTQEGGLKRSRSRLMPRVLFSEQRNLQARRTRA